MDITENFRTLRGSIEVPPKMVLEQRSRLCLSDRQAAMGVPITAQEYRISGTYKGLPREEQINSGGTTKHFRPWSYENRIRDFFCV